MHNLQGQKKLHNSVACMSIMMIISLYFPAPDKAKQKRNNG